MAHKDPMTWRPKERRWSKWYRGKYKNVSHRQMVKLGLLDASAPNTKEATRSAMRRWWTTTKAQVDNELRESEASKQTPEGIYLSGLGVDYGEDGAATSKMRIRIASKVRLPGGEIKDHVQELIKAGEGQLAKLRADACPLDETIGANIDAFVAFKRRQAEAGELSLDRADSLRIHLNEHFAGWIGSGASITELGETTIRKYYEHVLERAKQGAITRYYARDLFTSFKQFVRWLAHERLIAFPLNLNSRNLGFKVSSKPTRFADNEVSVLLSESSDRTRLYLLMMLNCGFTQVDIAELGKSKINLKSGEVTHKRFKTEEYGNVPTVVYPLWPETLRLLREHLNKEYQVTNRHGDVLALVTRDGEPLLVKSYDEEGRMKKKDAIRSAYNRVVSKLQRRGISVSGTLKHFRKTASSKLDEHENYGRYVVHFLGQSPGTVAGKHYVTPSQKQFELALAWLREQFGVASI